MGAWPIPFYYYYRTDSSCFHLGTLLKGHLCSALTPTTRTPSVFCPHRDWNQKPSDYDWNLIMMRCWGSKWTAGTNVRCKWMKDENEGLLQCDYTCDPSNGCRTNGVFETHHLIWLQVASVFQHPQEAPIEAEELQHKCYGNSEAGCKVRT